MLKSTRTAPGGASQADQTLSLNMRLLAQHELAGFGGLGEGMAVQQVADGRRILWLADESAPRNFSGVDVTDPKHPKLIVQTELPHAKVRSNSLDVVGNIMAVAYQTTWVDLKPAGVDLFDISIPERPRLISHFDCSGAHSRGVHAVWTVTPPPLHPWKRFPKGVGASVPTICMRTCRYRHHFAPTRLSSALFSMPEFGSTTPRIRIRCKRLPTTYRARPSSRLPEQFNSTMFMLMKIKSYTRWIASPGVCTFLK